MYRCENHLRRTLARDGRYYAQRRAFCAIRTSHSLNLEDRQGKRPGKGAILGIESQKQAHKP